MQHVRKMAVVPEHLVQKLYERERDEAQLFSTAPIKQIGSLDEQLKEILARDDLPPDLKVKEYQNVLQQYNAIRSKHVERSPHQRHEQTVAPRLPRVDVMRGIPVKYAARANELLDIAQNGMEWTEGGELVHRGQKIKGSNMADLIRTFVRPGRHRGDRPRGWREFGQSLVENNVPRTTITNKMLWNEIELPPVPGLENLTTPANIPNELYNTPSAPGPTTRKVARTRIKAGNPWQPYKQKNGK